MKKSAPAEGPKDIVDDSVGRETVEHCAGGSRILPKPPWLRVRLPTGGRATRLANLLHESCLHTVCEAALCPNIGECWKHGHATIMILGDVCTRQCNFCNVASGRSSPPDPEEPARVAQVVRKLRLTHVVLTSVTRDDLRDGGAALWAETIRRVRAIGPTIRIEALIPDFGGSNAALDLVLDARPDVLAHNLETVAQLYPWVRPKADYQRSLAVLARASSFGLVTKTGIMVGLGETREQIVGLMKDAVAAGCEIFTIGQYLQPSKKHLPIQRYVEPAEFEEYRRIGLGLGFKVVVAGPLVRSSYHSAEQDTFLESKRRLNGVDRKE